MVVVIGMVWCGGGGEVWCCVVMVMVMVRVRVVVVWCGVVMVMVRVVVVWCGGGDGVVW